MISFSEVLLKSYPNPFNTKITLEFNLNNPSLIELLIYDLTGKIRECIISKALNSGNHKIEWNAERMPSGIYFCVLKTNSGMQTKKMIKI